jgi:D-lactate dehydrogenase (cytochrome)
MYRCCKADKTLEESQKGLKELGLFSSIVGHVGDGNFHEAIMYHRTDPAETAAVDKHVRKMIAKALEMEGTSSVRKLLFLTTLLC